MPAFGLGVFQSSPEQTEVEVAAIDALDTGVRGGPDPGLVDTGMFPITNRKLRRGSARGDGALGLLRRALDGGQNNGRNQRPR